MLKFVAFALVAGLVGGGAAAKGGSHSSSGSHSTHTSSSSGGAHTVSGHVTKNGTYVAPHRQTNPNDTKHDNWSSKGNVNPDTGKAGTKDPSK